MSDKISHVRAYLACINLNRRCVQVRVIARKSITLRPASSRLVTKISGKTGRDKRKSFVYVTRKHPHEMESTFISKLFFVYNRVIEDTSKFYELI